MLSFLAGHWPMNAPKSMPCNLTLIDDFYLIIMVVVGNDAENNRSCNSNAMREKEITSEINDH